MNLPAGAATGKGRATEKTAELLRPQRLLILLLVALAAAGFYQLWAAAVDRALLVAEAQLIDSQITLQAKLSSATAQLDLLRVSIEQDLDGPLARPLPPPAAWLQPVPGRAAFAGPTPTLSPGGPVANVTLGAPLPGTDERGREVAAAAGQAPLFAAVKNNLGTVTWVYYYSLNRLLAIYPYEPGSIYWSDALLDREIVANAGPAGNPGRGYYWSDVYADSAGKGLMCSVVNPVYDRADHFRGIIGFDFSVDSLIAYLAGEELAIGTPFIVNKAGQLLAHPTLVTAADDRVHTLADALPPPLRPAAERLQSLPPGRFAAVGDAYVMALDLGTAPWRVLFVVDKRRLGLTVLGDMYFELAGLGLLLVVVFAFLKIDRLTVTLRKYMAAVENSDVAVMITDSRGVIEYVNKGFCRHSGYAAREAVGRTPRLLQSGQTLAATYRELWQTVTAGESWHGDLLNRRKDGSLFWAATDVSPVRSRWGTVTHFVAVQSDVTEKRRLEEELSRLAVTDPLTGLANRRRFMAALAGETERTRRSGRPFALLMVDIDHFKQVNDTYGHDAGDKVLVALAATLTAGVREIDTVGRLGGEEFAVLLPDTGLDGAVAAAERLRRAVAAMAAAAGDGTVLSVTASFGAAQQDTADIGTEELLRRADSALYGSKSNGRNRVTAYAAGD